jgi:hypothetical protein
VEYAVFYLLHNTGLSLKEVLDIDVVSFNAYVSMIDKVKMLDEVQRAMALRVAFHADGKEFKKWSDRMLKDTQSLPDDTQVRKEALAFLKRVKGKGF